MRQLPVTSPEINWHRPLPRNVCIAPSGSGSGRDGSMVGIGFLRAAGGRRGLAGRGGTSRRCNFPMTEHLVKPWPRARAIWLQDSPSLCNSRSFATLSSVHCDMLCPWRSPAPLITLIHALAIQSVQFRPHEFPDLLRGSVRKRPRYGAVGEFFCELAVFFDIGF